MVKDHVTRCHKGQHPEVGRACWNVSGLMSSQAPGRGAGQSMSHKVAVVKNAEVGNVHFVEVERPRNMAKAWA